MSRGAKSEAVMRPRRVRSLFVLCAGFGGLLAFIVAAAVGTLVKLDRVRSDDTRIRQEFLNRLQTLEQIRSDIYLSATDVRDFLLSNDADAAEIQRSGIIATQTETHKALDQYARSLDPEERDVFEALRSEIDAYWQVLQPAFQWSAAERNRRKYTFFYEQLVPRRTTMLQIADNIARINESGLNRAEERLAASANNLSWSLLLTFGITFIGGILLAAGTIVLTRRLEREVELRLKEASDARADLQELSAGLVRAQEEERRNLARELHDEVGQSLSAIMMEANAMGRSQDDSPPPMQMMHDRLASIAKIAEHTLNSVRDLALLLRPSMLDDFGLVPALNWHARETAKRTGLKIRVSADDSSDDLPDEHKTCVYRLAQEALTNAARHANARNAIVTVRSGERKVFFSVRDDGAGFDTRHVRGLGMLGMEERVRRLGGTLRVDSRPGQGTTVSAELPLPEATETGPAESEPLHEMETEPHAANSYSGG